MLTIALLIPAFALLALGGQGLYLATRSAEPVPVSCDELSRQPPPSPWVRITGCDINYAGAGYRQSGGTLQELLFPVHPAGASSSHPTRIVVATRNPSALAVAQRGLAGGRESGGERPFDMMQKALAPLRMSPGLEGTIRATWLGRLGARRVVSGLTTPLAEDVMVVDLQVKPSMATPLLQLGGGAVLLLATAVLLARRRRDAGKAHSGRRLDRSEEFLLQTDAPSMAELELGSEAATAPPTPADLPAAGSTEPATAAGVGISSSASGPRAEPVFEGSLTTVRLPSLLLLNLDATAGADAIEGAPPLGHRDEVVAQLREVVPDLTVDDRGQAVHRGPDHFVRIDLGSSDVVHTAVIEAHGETGVTVVRWMLDATGWRAFLPKRGTFVASDDLASVALRE